MVLSPVAAWPVVSREKMDFYTLLDNWVTKGQTPDKKQQHYVMAVLIRGGVFGEKSE
jgi:CRISPR-associated protein Csy3